MVERTDNPVFCSTIIPTIGRNTLSRAVNSVLEQIVHEEDFEIIVVNDSGKPLPAAAWQSSPRVKIIQTQRRERSVARNAGAAISSGKYLHFLDDDDWLLPAALEGLRQRALASQAVWVYGTSQLVDRQGKLLIQLEHAMQGNVFLQVMAGEWVPLQSSLIEAQTFFQVGGFQHFISAGEDVDLSRRVALKGAFAAAPHLVACIGMGEETSTSDHHSHARLSRMARELILSSPGVFQRMAVSARSPEWKGRMVRIYATSVLWNLQHLRFFTAFSRAALFLLSFLVSGLALFSSRFWKAFLTHYQSLTFQRGFEKFLEKGEVSG